MIVMYAGGLFVRSVMVPFGRFGAFSWSIWLVLFLVFCTFGWLNGLMLSI